MPSEDTKALEFDQYQKLDKTSSIIYADLECFREEIDGCKSLESLSTTKIGNIFHLVFQCLQYHQSEM